MRDPQAQARPSRVIVTLWLACFTINGFCLGVLVGKFYL